MRWKVALAMPVIVAAGLAATASSATVVAETTSAATEPSAAPAVGVLPGEVRDAQPLRSPSDPLAQLPPDAPAAAGGAAVLGDGPLAIPELVFYAYRAAEMQLAIDSPECGLPWNLLAAVGRLSSGHADGGRTDILGTLTTPVVTPEGLLGPMRLAPAAWEQYSADGNADGTADPQNIFDATLAAGARMCAEGGNLREPDGEARAVASVDPSPDYLANVRHWSGAYSKAAEVAPADLAPIPARPIPNAADVAAPAPAPAVTAPAPEATPQPADPPGPEAPADLPAQQAPADTPAQQAPEQNIPAPPPMPELPELPCLVPAFCE
ncbi:transglycosylase [Rhodococcus gordoniae]|uniref:Transglycosylase n=1 Tax=Rhodococcus gordoniae TaxID=223392 RepID=A0A379M4C9_9NOCA|nr:hypothetical protein [Rhodococcus gordoniae]SUE17204.1 transglycosylase [Rhodococcus gordoniae]